MKNYTGTNFYNWKKAEYKLVRTIDRRTRAGKDVVDNGDIPLHITLDNGARVWSFGDRRAA